jgi:hypothetical protein
MPSRRGDSLESEDEGPLDLSDLPPPPILKPLGAIVVEVRHLQKCT